MPGDASDPLIGWAGRVAALDPSDRAALAGVGAEIEEHLEADPDLDDPAAAHLDLVLDALEALHAGTGGDPPGIRDAVAALLTAMAGGGDGIDAARRHLEERLAPPAPPDSPEILPGGVDATLVDEFLAEAREHLAVAEDALLACEQAARAEGRPPREALDGLLRTFHTLKGMAGFLGSTAVGSLAHAAEDLLEGVRSGARPLDAATGSLLLETVDTLRRLVDLVEVSAAGGDPEPPGNLAGLLEALSGGVWGPSGGERPAAHAPSTAPGNGPRPPAPRGDRSVRVSTERLDRLVALVGELVVTHSTIAVEEIVTTQERLARKVDVAAKLTRELQDLALAMAMVRLKGTLTKMGRVVRDAAARTGKDVDLVLEGEDTELDRNVVEAITDPLMHMVRNAVDHGVEAPEERRRAGKTARGTVRITAAQAGEHVLVRIADDGAGIDRGRVLAKARERGLTDGSHGLSDAEVAAFIFSAGFSTAERVTGVSGRGVGMDVVRRGIEAVGGRVEVTSVPGAGTTFSVRLPLTLAVTRGMLVGVGTERYVVPTTLIETTQQPGPDALVSTPGDGELVLSRGSLVPLVRIHDVFGVPDAVTDPTEGLVVVVDAGPRCAALLVDSLLGQLRVVAKPLPAAVAHTPGISGTAILGDGSVGLVLDVVELVSERPGHGTPDAADCPVEAAPGSAPAGPRRAHP